MAHAYEWGIRVVGQAPLRWPDRVVAAPRLTSLVQRGAVGGFAAEGGYSTNSPPVRSTHNLVGERSDANPPPLAPYICMERRIAIEKARKSEESLFRAFLMPSESIQQMVSFAFEKGFRFRFCGAEDSNRGAALAVEGNIEVPDHDIGILEV